MTAQSKFSTRLLALGACVAVLVSLAAPIASAQPVHSSPGRGGPGRGGPGDRGPGFGRAEDGYFSIGRQHYYASTSRGTYCHIPTVDQLNARKMSRGPISRFIGDFPRVPREYERGFERTCRDVAYPRSFYRAMRETGNQVFMTEGDGFYCYVIDPRTHRVLSRRTGIALMPIDYDYQSSAMRFRGNCPSF